MGAVMDIGMQCRMRPILLINDYDVRFVIPSLTGNDMILSGDLVTNSGCTMMCSAN